MDVLKNFSDKTKEFGGDRFLLLLQSKKNFKKLVKSLNFYDFGQNYGDTYIQSVSLFAQLFPQLIARYLTDIRNDLTCVTREFISFIVNNRLLLDRNLCYSPEVFPFVMNLIKKTTIGKEIVSFFEFGTGSGIDAKEIAEILSPDIVKKVAIFGYDPNSDPVKEVTLLNPNEIGSITFDLFLAKWVLHHVPLDSRWQTLRLFLKHCKKGSSVIFIEEGCLTEESLDQSALRQYELLHALSDALINASYEGKGFQNNFFIKYLTVNDLEKIEKNIPFPFTKNVFEIEHSFFKQTILQYILG